ncbi:MAG: response regulator transcription factor [Gammaproteobacteria bacterium]|nr:response regulator transcription factor [Gammaproteobacteria bacterium]
MPQTSACVSLLDDQEAVVLAAGRLLRAEGFAVRTWTSATAFLEAYDSAIPGCLVCDVRMPEMTGLELQQALLARDIRTPIIFMTGVGDVSMAARAMKAGAVTFLCKPVERVELVAAVREALACDAVVRARHQEERLISMRLAILTPRERQVLDLLTMGLMNKQIAHELGAAEKTIRKHRGRILEKMKVNSAAALVTMLASAQPPGQPVRRTLPR